MIGLVLCFLRRSDLVSAVDRPRFIRPTVPIFVSVLRSRLPCGQSYFLPNVIAALHWIIAGKGMDAKTIRRIRIREDSKRSVVRLVSWSRDNGRATLHGAAHGASNCPDIHHCPRQCGSVL